ncbi:MAG TPA: histidine kinase [Solirubrobacteraceae bacterium]|nr:histidine kinase [Solirubrobacteraceae bacterium]
MTEIDVNPARRRMFGPFGGIVWLAFVALPAVAMLASRHSVGHDVAMLGLAVAFCLLYGAELMPHRVSTGRVSAHRVALLGALAVVLSVADDSGWGFLFTYVAALAGAGLPGRLAPWGLVACTAAAAGCSAIGGDSGSIVITAAAVTGGVGFMMIGIGSLRRSNEALYAARTELARVAVAEERVRFARDLHDLLGHSLSLVALKAELSRRLLPDQPEQALVHVRELEGVARQALGEVRDAVGGYRRPTLAGELAGARRAFAAAGIDDAVDHAEVALDVEVDATLAWAVREATTNAIRHSGARHAWISVRPDGEDVVVEIADDGRGSSGASGGSGLHGLGERAAALGGRIESGMRPGGGFRLRVSVPRAGPLPAASALARR